MQKVLITGASGMLGSDLPKIWSRFTSVMGVDLGDFDITDREAVEKYFKTIRPDLVIHCAAFTNVDGAESQADTAMLINANGTKNIAYAAREVGAEVVYFSTDFVFDGKKGEPYLEDDPARPASVYGKSKYAGECSLREILPAHYIVRIAWLYGRHGSNFVYTIRNAARENKELKVVDDQIGSPTFTVDVAYHLRCIVERGQWGTWHLSAEGETSRYQFAQEVLKNCGIETPVRPVSTEEFPLPAPRPSYGVLSNQKYFKECGRKMPHWKESLAEFLHHYAL